MASALTTALAGQEVAADLSEVETPCLVLDRARLSRNTARMTERMRAHGVRLRPHLKTAKSIDVARMATEGNFGGITVSTVKEAEYFFGHGVTDIIYAVSMVPERMPRIARLVRAGANVSVITDSVAMAREIGRHAETFQIRLDTFVEIDCGEDRAGVTAESDALVEVARAVVGQRGTRLAGVLTHAGHSYRSRSIAAVEAVAEHERASAVLAAGRLRAAGLPCEIVSVGSTPTAVHGRSFEGVTEVRCGVYMFGDMFQCEIGSLGFDDIAVTVLATVIGHRPDLGTALIDAGALALSKDRSTGAPGLPEDIGFGLVLDGAGRHRIDGIRVGHVYQEHGLLVADGPFPYDRLPIGARVRVVPNHVCMTAAMYDTYHVVDGVDPTVVARWPRVNGW